MLCNNNNQLQTPAPKIPTFYNVLSITGGTGAVSARQTSLEATNIRSWSGWFNPLSQDMGFQYALFMGSTTTATTRQYGFQFADATTNSSITQCFQFIIWTNNSNFITITSSYKILKNRWHHIVVTWDGVDQTGFKLYINGIEDSSATKAETGTYTAPLNNAALRLCLSIVAGSASHYDGYIRDLSLWSAELSSANVTELFNNGTPVSVPSVSFYANIVSYWELQTDAVSDQNAAFNFSLSGSTNFISTSLSPYYPYMTITNADVTNTRYVAFGSLVMINRDLVYAFERSGTTHLLNGRIDKYSFIPSQIKSFTPISKVTVYTDATYDLRSAAAGITEDFITIGTSQYEDPSIWHDTFVIESTDGLTGSTFGSPTVVTPPDEVNNTFAHIIRSNSALEYILPTYSFDGTDYYLGYFESVGGVWTYVPVYQNTTEYQEPAFVNCGNGLIIMVCRKTTLTGDGLFMSYSQDGGGTWSAIADTGLGSGVCMCDMCLSDKGTIELIFADRDTNDVYISEGNVPSALVASPTAWVTPFIILRNPTGGTILGYPNIINMGDGYFAIAVSYESTLSKADLFVGHGILR